MEPAGLSNRTVAVTRVDMTGSLRKGLSAKKEFVTQAIAMIMRLINPHKVLNVRLAGHLVYVVLCKCSRFWDVPHSYLENNGVVQMFCSVGIIHQQSPNVSYVELTFIRSERQFVVSRIYNVARNLSL